MKRAASWLMTALVVSGARAASGEPAPVVRLFVAGSAEAVSGMRDALQDQCARPNLAVMVRDAASADAELLDTTPSVGLADAYVDLRPDYEMRVIVVDGQTHERLEERTLGRTSSLQVSVEMVAQVVCTAIDSLLTARPTAPAVNESMLLPPPLPAATATPSRVTQERRQRSLERSPVAWAGVFGAAANHGAGMQGGAGAIFTASVGSTPVRFGGSILIDGFPGLELKRQGAEAALDVYGVRLLPTLEWDASPRWNVFASLGVGADWLRLSPGNPPPGGVPRGDTNRSEPLLSSLLGAKFSLANHFRAWLALGADMNLARHRYVNEANGSATIFFESSRVRPVGLAGLAVTFGQEPVFADLEASTVPAEPQ